MASLATLAITRLSTMVVDLKTTATPRLLYTVPAGRSLVVHRLVVRAVTASLVNGTSYSLTNWKSAFSLAGLTTITTHYVIVDPVSDALTTPTQYQISVAGTAINLTVNTNSGSASTGTVDLYGTLF